MVIFIDESGTHKLTDHTSIALVYVEVPNLELFEKQIVKIEKSLEISHFHWTEERWKTRELFMDKLLDLDFVFKVAILNNPVKISNKLEEVLSHLIWEKNIKTVIIDGKKPRWFEQRLKKVLRSRDVTVKKLRTVRKDESSPGLRVADCLAGLSRYTWDNPDSKAKVIYDRFAKRGKLSFELIAK